MNKLQIFSPVAFSAANDDGLPLKFSGVAYSGGRVPGFNAVVDLETANVEPDMPLLDGHANENASVIGVVSDTATEERALKISGALFSDIDSTAKSIALKSARGAKYQMSIGIYECSEEHVQSGAKVNVNGQEFTGPLYVLRNAHIRETSIIPLGADDKTSASFFKAMAESQEPKMTIEELTAKNTALTAELSASKAAAQALEGKLAALTAELAAEKEKTAEQAKAVRNKEIKALAEKTGVTLTDDATAVYMSMDEATFNQVSATLLAAAPKGGDGLSDEHITGGEDAGANDGASGKSSGKAGDYLMAAVKQINGAE